MLGHCSRVRRRPPATARADLSRGRSSACRERASADAARARATLAADLHGGGTERWSTDRRVCRHHLYSLGEDRADPGALPRARGCLRASLGESSFGQEWLHTRGRRWLGRSPRRPEAIPPPVRRDDREASPRPRVDRHLPAAEGRQLLVARMRPRRQRVATRRDGASRGVHRPRRADGVGEEPVRKRRSPLGLLQLAGDSRFGAPARGAPASRGDGEPRRARPRKLRPALPKPGLPAAEGIREPDRAAAPKANADRQERASSSTRRRWSRRPINGRCSARSSDCHRKRSNPSSPRAATSRSVPRRSQRARGAHGTNDSRPKSPARSEPTSRSRRQAFRRRCSPNSSTSPRCTTRTSTSASGSGSPPTRHRD